MATISLCMIVKNEEEVLSQCLNSVHNICDEIIIVDTGSVDRTKEIAREFTDKVYEFQWIDHFAAARNYAFSKATKDYIFWLDADDVILKGDQEKLAKLKQNLHSSIDGVSMNYILEFDKNGDPSFYFRRNRLIKRANHFKWIGRVHEYLEVGGHIIQSDIAIVHRKSDKSEKNIVSDRNIKIYEKQIEEGEALSIRDLFYYANELKEHQYFEKAITYYERFLATKEGWVEDNIRACLSLAECYKKINKFDASVEKLLHALTFDSPRPEVCCRLGDYFLEKNDFKTAIFWYETAVKNEVQNPQSFHNKSFSTWYPHLSLCVCYWNIGDFDKAIGSNQIVKKQYPNDLRVQYNEEFFANYLQQQEQHLN